jgi:hypothetical protein
VPIHPWSHASPQSGLTVPTVSLVRGISLCSDRQAVRELTHLPCRTVRQRAFGLRRLDSPTCRGHVWGTKAKPSGEAGSPTALLSDVRPVENLRTFRDVLFLGEKTRRPKHNRNWLRSARTQEEPATFRVKTRLSERVLWITCCKAFQRLSHSIVALRTHFLRHS